jgi:UvrD/REP helicase N-terminal domain
VSRASPFFNASVVSARKPLSSMESATGPLLPSRADPCTFLCVTGDVCDECGSGWKTFCGGCSCCGPQGCRSTVAPSRLGAAPRRFPPDRKLRPCESGRLARKLDSLGRPRERPLGCASDRAARPILPDRATGIATLSRQWYRQSPEQKRNTNCNRLALLIAAGAGTGKTKALAHRVAHLILNGRDPQRLLLLTFTRRAALEMTRRSQLILAEARGNAARDISTPSSLLPWSGTFHAIGSFTVNPNTSV